MRISVICPVYDTDPALLEEAVRSVLAQAGGHELELLIVDDASSKSATREALLGLAASDLRIRVIWSETNAGPSVARQTGLAHASFDLIGFIDADDVWPNDKLLMAEQVLTEHPGTEWLCGSHSILRANGVALEQTALIDNYPDPCEPGPAPVLQGLSLMRALITTMPPLGASIIQRGLLDSAGGLDPRLRYGEDWLLYLKLSKIAQMRLLSRPTYILRRQRASMMQSKGRMSQLYITSILLAMRDPMLYAIRKELRWYLYSSLKSVAMNRALNGMTFKGVYYAAVALTRDPREVREFLLYLRALTLVGPERQEHLKKYCSSDQIILDQLPA